MTKKTPRIPQLNSYEHDRTPDTPEATGVVRLRVVETAEAGLRQATRALQPKVYPELPYEKLNAARLNAFDEAQPTSRMAEEVAKNGVAFPGRTQQGVSQASTPEQATTSQISPNNVVSFPQQAQSSGEQPAAETGVSVTPLIDLEAERQARERAATDKVNAIHNQNGQTGQLQNPIEGRAA